jgi:hypothetical protein
VGDCARIEAVVKEAILGREYEAGDVGRGGRGSQEPGKYFLASLRGSGGSAGADTWLAAP